MIETWGTEIALVIALVGSFYVHNVGKQAQAPKQIIWLGRTAIGCSLLVVVMYLIALMNGVNL